MFRMIEGLLVGTIIMTIGALATVVYHAGMERQKMREQIKHRVTDKEMTDEIAETRHVLRNEMQIKLGELQALIEKHHPIGRN